MSPLSSKLRKRVLYVLFVLFVILTPILIGYSKGYRLDDALGLIQTGGIYLHSDIANTSVYIDDEFIENNGAFLRNTLVQNLLPNRYYAVRVQHEEYQSWVKVLLVKPRFVTEARVLMLPKEFTWQFVYPTSTIPQTENVETGTTSATSTILEREVTNPEFVEFEETFTETRDQFAIEVATSTYEYIRGVRYPTTTTVTEIRFPDWFNEVASTTELLEKEMVRERDGIITWIENGDVFALWARDDAIHPYFFCATTCKEKLAINWSEDITRYDFYPNRNDALIIESERGVYAVELDNRSQRNIQPILEEPNLSFRLLQDGTIAIYDGKTFRLTSW
jgi:hypothetical protein